MKEISIKEIAEAVRGKVISGDENMTVSGVAIDSRASGDSDLFIPLKGENHDAHDFVGGAFDNGTRAFLISEEKAAEDLGGATVVLVTDTSKALLDLAFSYLEKLDIKKIAVTGSVGKTSTRDMIYYIASSKYKTMRPEKNYNNEVGVPLTIFGLDDSYGACVFEEGLHYPGDIHRLSAVTRPDVAVITNVGVSHLENFESREALYRAKLEVADFMGEGDALVINTDSDIVKKEDIDGPYDLISCGKDGSDDYIVADIKDKGCDGVRFTLSNKGKDYDVALPVPGAHNAMNAALSIAACERIGIGIEEAVKALKKLELTGDRLNVKRGNDKVVIDDSYNAAPDSVKSALRTLMNTEGARHVAVLAGMNELGGDSESLHEDVGRYAAEEKADLIIGIGEKAEAITDAAKDAGAETMWYPDKGAFFDDMESVILDGDVVLVKGSNAFGLSEIADRIVE